MNGWLHDDVLRAALRCPACRQPLNPKTFVCLSCSAEYRFADGVLDVLHPIERQSAAQATREIRENRLKNFFKRWPVFYHWLALAVSPVLYTGHTVRRFVRRLPSNARVLNVGSGSLRLSPRAVNLDMLPFLNVDVVASAERLPFMDRTFDAVCSDQLLEHVANPQAVADEFVRVTKPGGLIYAGVPFVYPWHPSPEDYSRWTSPGVARLFSGCELVESGVLIGPTSGMLVVFANWLGFALSFGSRTLRPILQYFFMLCLSPFRLFDVILVRLPGAECTAAAVYVVVCKR